MILLHSSAAGHAHFNGDFFHNGSELIRCKPDFCVVDGFFFELQEWSPQMISPLLSFCIDSLFEVRNEGKEAIVDQKIQN